MRSSTVVGLFFCLVGLMLLVLQPVYHAPLEENTRGLEATGPIEESRPIPPWVGLLSIGIGAGGIIAGLRPARRRRP
jgi:uncharacterized membrane protein